MGGNGSKSVVSQKPEPTLAQAEATMVEMGRVPVSALRTDLCYITGIATKQIGGKYFVPIDDVQYVGRFVRYEKGGFGNGSWTQAIFSKDGKEEIVDFDYNGMRVFHWGKCQPANANKPTGGYRHTRRASKKARRTHRKTRK
jgi:hypothetical protein